MFCLRKGSRGYHFVPFKLCAEAGISEVQSSIVCICSTHDHWKVRKEGNLSIVREAKRLHPDPDGKLVVLVKHLSAFGYTKGRRHKFSVLDDVRFRESSSW